MNPLKLLIDDYIRKHRRVAERQQQWFSIQPDLRTAVEVAVLATSPSGKRLHHQRRIPGRVLQESCARLLERLPELERAPSFEELHQLVGSIIRPIWGIGELAIYDTALRIGAFLRLEPSKVFLHAGTRAGVRALGLDVSREFVEVTELPVEFHSLTPREVEDALCIYKDRFHSAVPAQQDALADAARGALADSHLPGTTLRPATPEAGK
ncbi:MAG: hypothetical protein NTW87_14100 [Planctomycetota bacterium]|nr:hypothetical protein [Planctomycetota bacterium]